MARPSIAKFLMGGAVPKAHAGDILEALFLAGASHVNCTPYETLIPGERAPQPGIKHTKVKELPAPQVERANGHTERYGKMKPGGATEQLLKHIAEAKGAPVQRKDLLEILTTTGKDGNRLSGYLDRLIKWGQIVRVDVGVYALAPGTETPAAKPAKTAPKKSGAAPKKSGKPPRLLNATGKSHSEHVVAILKRAHPKTRTLQQLRQQFTDLGLREASVSVALSALKKEGRVASPAAATYIYIPE